jgi:hypothetical protein
MADMFTGTVAPDVTTNKTQATTAPQYFTNYLSDIAQTGQAALNRPMDQLVAPLTDMQNQGYAAVPGAAEAYKPGLASAQQTAAGVAGGITPNRIQNLMNPYTSGVVDEMARLQQKNVQQNVMPQLKAGFVGSGGLGGQRYANATGQTMADLQANLTGQQTGALQSGYNSALQAAIQEMQTQNQAAQLQGNLAGKEQELGLTGAGALTKAGAEQQAFKQAQINAPLTNAGNVAALMRGYNVPTTVTETYKGPLPGAYGNSPLSQVAGLGTLLGSAFNTTTDAKGNVINSGYGNQLFDWLKSKFPSSSTTSPTTGGGTVDANGNPIYGGGAVVNDPLGGTPTDIPLDVIGGNNTSPAVVDQTQAWEDYYNSLSNQSNPDYYNQG